MPSFTELAILNPKVLDLIYPSDCKLKKIQDVGSHVILTLSKNKIEDFISRKVKAIVASRQFTIFCRVLYISLVTMIIAPAGVIWNGCLSIKHFTASKFAADADKTQEMEKSRAYAKAFFVDLFSFKVCVISNALLVGTLFISAKILVHAPASRVKLVALLIAIVHVGIASIFPYFILGGFDPKWTLKELIAQKDEKPGLELAIALREGFGLVDNSGGLLPFSAQNKFEYTANERGYTFHESRSQLCIYEMVVKDRINALNILLYKHQLVPISYSYPCYPSLPKNIYTKIVSIKNEQDKNAARKIVNSLIHLNEPIPIMLKKVELSYTDL